ncbi:MAG TPA: SAM-dependent methyltransferase [Burkholderiales bacterium]|nr:SAM-dependent methyltransferase [Burkholderiales bacterium]
MSPRSRIAAEIAAAGGWLSFERYMQLALHEPGIGYYASGARKFGARGDFVTAPELGSLYGRTLARELARFERILELGAGSGALADVLTRELHCEYLVLETSAELRQRQRERLGDRVRHLERVPEHFRGAVIANEVVDAMPVHMVHWTEAGIMERGVSAQFSWSDRPAIGAVLASAQRITVRAPYVSEIGLAARAWMRTLAQSLEQGAIFVIDYGFPAREYYHPQRASGTLMCHYQHRAHADPFARPGEEDITAHVDFSALALAAAEAGAQVLGYTTQAQFLVNCGITDVLGQANVENALHYAPLAAEAQRLLSPAEMGELFKVLAVGTADCPPLCGFSNGDRRASL